MHDLSPLIMKDFFLMIRTKRPREIILKSTLILSLYVFTIYTYGSPKLIYGFAFLISFLSFYAPLIFNLDTQVYIKLFTTPVLLSRYVKSKIFFIQVINFIYGLIVVTISMIFSFDQSLLILSFTILNSSLLTYLTLYFSSFKLTPIDVSLRKPSPLNGYNINNFISMLSPLILLMTIIIIDVLFDPSNLTIAAALVIISVLHYLIFRKIWEKKIEANLIKNKHHMHND